jgi:hypothetical protein
MQSSMDSSGKTNGVWRVGHPRLGEIQHNTQTEVALVLLDGAG